MKHNLPPLPYPYNALEPYLDARTMELHHAKHHQTYVDKLNAALDKHPELFDTSLEELLRKTETAPEDIRAAVRNHGGGHFNHSLFWQLMKPPQQGGGGVAQGKIAEGIHKTFGDFQKFKEQFTAVAVGVFGSGWAWLVQNSAGALSIVTTPNQDSPITAGQRPLLGVDVWEHAYYLKYQNRRPEYVEAWWNIINWQEVERRLAEMK